MFSAFARTVLVPLLLRAALAAVFIYHGLDLVGGPDKGWGTAWQEQAHVPEPMPAPAQAAVAWGELLGGLAMALGFLTRLAAAGLIVIMGGAIATVHLPHGFDIRQHGYEYNVALIAMCLCLVLAGPGPLAVDRFFRLRRRELR
jgi:putative oxidoreductase